MSSYSELVKNFEKIRQIMREFYVYGFKSREEYQAKSLRSYDNDRRRMESWLGDHMSFVRTSEGKNMFISIDSRSCSHNPLYKALKAKSFTDGDITLHFILLDILDSPETVLSLPDILKRIDGYLSEFESPLVFDDSTVRKKLKEYIELGVIEGVKCGRKMMYRRADTLDVSEFTDALSYYSEVAPCGVIGSFLLDKTDNADGVFSFKHHYITSALDSGVLTSLFVAMQKKSVITVKNLGRNISEPQELRMIPLRIFISAQSGRQYLLAYQPDRNAIRAFRVDYLFGVKLENPSPRFDELRAELDYMQGKMWGVSVRKELNGKAKTEHVEFTVKVEKGEEHIIRRLQREKRIGRVEKLDNGSYRFTADVYDANELLPWIRSFICRLTNVSFSNKTVESIFKSDLDKMYKIYGIGEVKQ